MPCRVGITTDPDRRRREQKNSHYGFTNWHIVKAFAKRSDAQDYERWYASRYDCQASGGGRIARGPWYVYVFTYSRKK